MTNAETIHIDLGFIGHSAEKLQAMFQTYSKEPNENGYYLMFENYSAAVVNQGVMVETNCFKNKKQFKKALLSKLLFSLDQ
jgi:hypothetical protein